MEREEDSSLYERNLLKEWQNEKGCLENENYNMKLRINFLEEKLQVYSSGTSLPMEEAQHEVMRYKAENSLLSQKMLKQSTQIDVIRTQCQKLVIEFTTLEEEHGKSLAEIQTWSDRERLVKLQMDALKQDNAKNERSIHDLKKESKEKTSTFEKEMQDMRQEHSRILADEKEMILEMEIKIQDKEKAMFALKKGHDEMHREERKERDLVEKRGKDMVHQLKILKQEKQQATIETSELEKKLQLVTYQMNMKQEQQNQTLLNYEKDITRVQQALEKMEKEKDVSSTHYEAQAREYRTVTDRLGRELNQEVSSKQDEFNIARNTLQVSLTEATTRLEYTKNQVEMKDASLAELQLQLQTERTRVVELSALLQVAESASADGMQAQEALQLQLSNLGRQHAADLNANQVTATTQNNQLQETILHMQKNMDALAQSSSAGTDSDARWKLQVRILQFYRYKLMLTMFVDRFLNGISNLEIY